MRGGAIYRANKEGSDQCGVENSQYFKGGGHNNSRGRAGVVRMVVVITAGVTTRVPHLTEIGWDGLVRVP